MIETKTEKLCNKIQVIFFLIDMLEKGERVSDDMVDSISETLPTIQNLLKDIERDNTQTKEKFLSFGKHLVGTENVNLDKLYEEWNSINKTT